MTQALIERLRDETARIWLMCPEEVSALGSGRAEKPTGSREQYLTPVLFAESSTRLFTDEVLWGVLHSLTVPRLDVGTIAYIAQQAARRKAEFYQFIDLKDVSKMALSYADAVGGTTDNDEIRRLTEAALAYFNRIHVWLDSVVPWGICDGFPLERGLRPERRS